MLRLLSGWLFRWLTILSSRLSKKKFQHHQGEYESKDAQNENPRPMLANDTQAAIYKLMDH